LQNGIENAIVPMQQSNESGFSQTALIAYNQNTSTASIFRFKAT